MVPPARPRDGDAAARCPALERLAPEAEAPRAGRGCRARAGRGRRCRRTATRRGRRTTPPGRPPRAPRHCTSTRVIGGPSGAPSGTSGSCARTSAPSSARRSAIRIAGDPRQSLVPGLVREAEQQDARAVHRSLVVVQDRHDASDHVVGHAAVHFVGELDEAESLADPALDPPREVRGVDGQAVAADAGPGSETHEAVGLGRRGIDRRPDVDAEARARTSRAR